MFTVADSHRGTLFSVVGFAFHLQTTSVDDDKGTIATLNRGSVQGVFVFMIAYGLAR